MPSSFPPQPVTTGSSSQTRLPFAGQGPAVVRQETVLSTPRPAEGDFHPSGDDTPRSPISLKLFPEQVQPTSSEDVIGTTLGHFVLEGRLGAGGMGTVFLARDERLQRRVALKVLSPQQTADPASVQRFQNEARSAARLDHDHVARVFYCGDDQGLHYIAYEYVEGTNLRDLIRERGRLEPAEVVAYAVQLAAALCHTSSCGVVHRDIKPSNIIVTPQSKAKLVDLGLARKESLEESAQLTVAGTTLGTFDYISPEQAKDPRNVDVRSDIYSLGCTLYHALTGEPPFPDGTVLQRLLDHQDKPPPDPAAKNRRVSPALSAIVRKMMAGDPRHRYPSAEDLLRDLLVISRAMGLRTLPGDSALLTAWNGAPGRFDWSQHALWIVAAAALLLAAVALQVFPDAARNLVGMEADEPPSAVAATADKGLPVESGTVGSAASPLPTAAESAQYLPARSKTELPDTATSSRTIPPTFVSPEPDIAGELLAPDRVLPRFPVSSVTPTPLFDGNLPLLSSTQTPPAELIPDAIQPPGSKPSTSEPATIAAPADATRTPREPTPGAASTDSTAAISSATAPEAVSASPVVEGPFEILGTGKTYSNLEAALADAKDQTVTIELDFDGRLPMPERPLRLINKRVVLQAARGRKPVLWFAPREAVTDPYQTRMMSVTGGALSLVNVAVELKVPETSSADLWAVFRLSRPERFRLERSLVTVLNPGRAPVAIAELSAPDSDTFSKMGTMKDGQPLVPPEIIIEDSIVRGEAAGLRIRDATSLHVEFRQSLFALGEWLFQAEPDPQGMNASLRLAVDLSNTTCLLGQGLLKTSDSEAITNRPSPLEIRAHNNVFAVGPSAAFIEQRFPSTAMDPHRSVIWVGEQNYFDSIGQFWLVQTPGPLGEQRWDYQAWRNYWGPGEISGSQNLALTWKTPWRLKEWARISAEDIPLEPLVSAIPPAGPNDVEVGADADRLPAERPEAR